MWPEAARDLLSPEPVNHQGQMRAVLLEGPQGQEHHAPGIGGEPGRLDERALGEADHPQFSLNVSAARLAM